tara:strand:+ start:27 stop:2669 length:2643 start_codon:yes stop_codon:yes gene_type:complete
MATLEELEDALIAAGEAGNTDATARISEAMRAHPTFQLNAKKQLDSGAYKLDSEGVMELGKGESRANMSKYLARSMGLRDSEVDVTQGMGTYGRFKLSFQPTEKDKVKHLEDTYGRENIRAAEVGGKMKILYRDDQETGGKFRAVDEEGVSLADFFGDTAGYVPEIGGAIAGGIKGAALGTLAGGPVGTVVGGVLGAAGGGFATAAAQDVATRAVSDEDIQLGEIAGRRGKEALIGGVADVALLGAGRALRPLIRSKLTGDVSAEAFAKVAGDLPEGSLTPRMMQGDKALTRELGLEDQINGRVGDARQAISDAANREIGQVSTEAFEKFTVRATKERDELLQSVPAGNKKLADQVEKQYQDKLNRFGAGEGRVVADIGDEIIKDSVEPALKASRAKKNGLYARFDAEDARTGGIFTAEQVDDRFASVINANGLKNTQGVESVRKQIQADAEMGKKYTLKEVDDLISNVTDAMPDGVLKSRTAQQVAAQLSDSLGTMVKRKAKQYPELNNAWKEANAYYKDTYTTFGRGGIGGATKDASGQAVLSGQGFIKSILSDPRQIKNLTAIAKEGGISPSVLKGRLKEAFLTSKGVQKGKPLTLSADDRGVVQELWGKSGLKRLEKIEKGMKASPEDLDAYLGAMSDKQASAARKTLVANAKEAAKLDDFKQNSMLKKMVAGDLPTENPEEISRAFLKASKSQRKQILGRMSDEPAALADLRSMVGSDLLTADLLNSGVKNAIGENVFNGKAVLDKLTRKKAAYVDALGRKEYQKLVDLADAQSKLSPLTKSEADIRLRATFGKSGLSMYGAGDLIQKIQDKVVSLAYRTKSLDKFMSGWSKADPEAIKKAMDTMLNGSRANRAFLDMDDPEFEQDIRDIRAAMD